MPVPEPSRIAVYTPEAGGYYLGDLLQGIDAACRSRRAQPIVVQTGFSWESHILQSAPIGMYLRVAGHLRSGSIAVTSILSDADIALYGNFDDPLVAVAGPPARADGVSIVVDNVGGAAVAVKHLIDHGHQRIGFVGSFVQYDVRERYRGYLKALEAAGIEPDPSLCFAAQDDLSAGGRAAGDTILNAGVPPTAVFAATDTHAIPLMERLREGGLRVPEDVAVIGFDDSELAQTAVPALTSVRQIPGALGAAAAELLLDQITGVSVRRPRPLPTSLIQRHSCGCFHAHEHMLEASADWNAPHWQEHLADVLVGRLFAQPGPPRGRVDRHEVWPSVGVVIEAFDDAIQGRNVTSISGLDEAWWEASTTTRNAETLLQLVDLLEFVGLCRQGPANADRSTLRCKLDDFLAQSRLQVLRYAAIADSLRSPDAPRITRQLIRSFIEGGDANHPSLDWLSTVEALSGCLGLWESPAAGTRPGLRIEALFGACGRAQRGSVVELESFPPVDWLAACQVAQTPCAVTVAPVVGRSRNWGLLAAALPEKHRYYGGYWGLHYGAGLLALWLDARARG